MSLLVVWRINRSADPTDFQRGEVVQVFANDASVGTRIRNDARFGILIVTDDNSPGRQKYLEEGRPGPPTVMPRPGHPDGPLITPTTLNRRRYVIDPGPLPAGTRAREFPLAINYGEGAPVELVTEAELEDAVVDRDTGLFVVPASLPRI